MAGSHGPMERVYWNGRAYRRYPQSKNRNLALYYRRTGSYLHRDVWESVYGPIPDGHAIHHIDHDPGNNSIENLECISCSEHMSMHMQDPGRIEMSKRALDAARVFQKQWHKTPAGMAQHSRNGEITAEKWKTVVPAECKCDICGATFGSKRGDAKICSNKCHAEHRRRSGVDDEDRECYMCGKVYRINKYAKQHTCSRECGKRRNAQRLSGTP